jgi:uncharacterized membrane protein YkvA (DUF1232 family)
MTVLKRWKQRARQLEMETYALYIAVKDPRLPWYSRVLALCVVAYAISPIDLIPDFIPVLGYLDDLILIPLGIALVLRTIPPEVMTESRQKAQAVLSDGKPSNWVAAGIIIMVWLTLAVLAGVFVWRLLRK